MIRGCFSRDKDIEALWEMIFRKNAYMFFHSIATPFEAGDPIYPREIYIEIGDAVLSQMLQEKLPSRLPQIINNFRSNKYD
jgi:hypothetical protein